MKGRERNGARSPSVPRKLGGGLDSESKVELANVVVRGWARRCDGRDSRSEPEVIEDLGGEVGMGEEGKQAKGSATARALGNVLAI